MENGPDDLLTAMAMNFNHVIASIGVGSRHVDHHDLIDVLSLRVNEKAMVKPVGLEKNIGRTGAEVLLGYFKGIGSGNPNDCDPPLTDGGRGRNYCIAGMH